MRAVFRNKGMSRQRLGGIAPYGYVKGENGQLLIDEETAPVPDIVAVGRGLAYADLLPGDGQELVSRCHYYLQHFLRR